MRGLRLSLPVLLTVIVLVVIAGAAWLEIRNYQTVRDGAMAVLRQRVFAIAESEAASFHVADTALRSVVAERQLVLSDETHNPNAVRKHLEALAVALPQVRGLTIVDADGGIDVSTAASRRPDRQSLALELRVDDRDYFRWFATGPGATDPSLAPFVGQPVRSRLDGSWFLGMSRPILGPDGGFAGVGLAVFSLDWFDEVNQISTLPPESSLILYTRQGTVVDASLPDGDRASAIGRPLEVLLPVSGVDAVRRTAGASSRPIAEALEEGLVAVAPLPGVPLQVMAFQPWKSVLAEWLWHVIADAALLVLALMGVLGLAVPLVRTLRDRDRLFALSPGPICVCDGDGRILRTNAAWPRLLGRPAISVVGQRHLDLAAPEDADILLRVQARLLSGQAVQDITVRYPRPDGKTLWLAWSGAAEGMRMFLHAHDITHRRAAEEALRRSEQRFRDVAEAASEFIWEVTSDGRLSYVSRRVRSVLGAAPDDLRGQSLSGLLAPEGRPVLEAALSRSAPFVVEVPARRGETEVWLRLSGQPVHWAEFGPEGRGEATGYRGAAQDITESRQARQALLDSEARYRGIVNTIVDAIVTIDESGIIRSVNPAAEHLFGYAAREMIGANVSILMPEPDRSGHDGYLRAYLRTGMSRYIGVDREVLARRKDGVIFPMDLGLSEVFLGNQRFFIGACRDLTERKRVERLKDEFIATVSHELRTPLTAIRGALGLISGGVAGSLPDKAGGLVKVALANCDTLAALVNDILDIERLEDGGPPLVLEPVDLGAVVDRVLRDLGPTLDADGLTVDLEAASETPLLVSGDLERLSQMIANLMSNAIKFSPAGGRVRVGLGDADGMAVLTVTDQGPGIPDAFRDHVFERFSQADGSTTRGQEGTGLGLAIVRAIVERHQGDISFTTVTEPPSGTTFQVRLPLLRQVTARISEDAREVSP